MTAPIAFRIDHFRDALVVTAQVPGTRAEDLRLCFSPDELTIEARSEAGVRACVLPLASPIDQRRASLHLSGGVLSLRLPTCASPEVGGR